MSSYGDSLRCMTLAQHLETFRGWRDILKVNYDSTIGTFCNDYTNLLQELHTEQKPITPTELEAMSQHNQEYVLFMMRNMQMLATAQASLMFPALVPTVHISNVVVDISCRGQGHGEMIMLYLRKLCLETWGRQHGQLRFILTSQSKRGIQDFYKRLGFIPTETIRYTL